MAEKILNIKTKSLNKRHENVMKQTIEQIRMIVTSKAYKIKRRMR